jgi:hypothetical protein
VVTALDDSQNFIAQAFADVKGFFSLDVLFPAIRVNKSTKPTNPAPKQSRNMDFFVRPKHSNL